MQSNHAQATNQNAKRSGRLRVVVVHKNRTWHIFFAEDHG